MPSNTNDNRPMRVILAIAAVLLVGGGVWAFSSSSNSTSNPSSPAVLAAADDNPGKVFDKMRELQHRTDLTDDQRRQQMGALRDQMDAQIDIRVNAYFTATTPEEKNRLLDKSIDDMEKRRQEFENERRREDANTASSRPSREERRRQWMNSTPQERKTRSESRSADNEARRRAYRAAMEGRMKERGIKPPQWGGPGGNRGGNNSGGNRRT